MSERPEEGAIEADSGSDRSSCPGSPATRLSSPAPPRSHPFSISRLLAPTDAEEQRLSRAEEQRAAPELLGPLRLFPGALCAGGVIRVPAHRPPGSPLLPSPWLLAAGSAQAQQQQQAAAAAVAGYQTARFLANLAAHPLQAHPHLKDRLAGEWRAASSDAGDQCQVLSLYAFRRMSSW